MKDFFPLKASAQALQIKGFFPLKASSQVLQLKDLMLNQNLKSSSKTYFLFNDKTKPQYENDACALCCKHYN